MSILHTVNKSPFTHSTLGSCLPVLQSGDALLLIEDGVYGGLNSCPLAQTLEDLKNRGVALFTLIEDARARGIEDQQSSAFTAVDYTRFVELCAQHKSVQSWY